MGESAEESFEKIALQKGFTVKTATRKQEFSHIDFILMRDGQNDVFVDVKACKKSSRSAGIANEEIVWVEFKNVVGNIGWIYGAADIIAFEREKDFVLVPRLRLITLCERIVNFNKRVDSTRDALYNLYTRKDRKDEISLIKMKDITSGIKVTYWLK